MSPINNYFQSFIFSLRFKNKKDFSLHSEFKSLRDKYFNDYKSQTKCFCYYLGKQLEDLKNTHIKCQKMIHNRFI